jgi:hypothetical protein
VGQFCDLSEIADGLPLSGQALPCSRHHPRRLWQPVERRHFPFDQLDWASAIAGHTGHSGFGDGLSAAMVLGEPLAVPLIVSPSQSVVRAATLMVAVRPQSGQRRRNDNGPVILRSTILNPNTTPTQTNPRQTTTRQQRRRKGQSRKCRSACHALSHPNTTTAQSA